MLTTALLSLAVIGSAASGSGDRGSVFAFNEIVAYPHDLDCDLGTELLCASGMTAEIAMFSGRDLALLWRIGVPSQHQGNAYTPVIAEDLDEDGFRDVLLLGRKGEVWALSGVDGDYLGVVHSGVGRTSRLLSSWSEADGVFFALLARPGGEQVHLVIADCGGGTVREVAVARRELDRMAGCVVSSGSGSLVVVSDDSGDLVLLDVVSGMLLGVRDFGVHEGVVGSVSLLRPQFSEAVVSDLVVGVYDQSRGATLLLSKDDLSSTWSVFGDAHSGEGFRVGCAGDVNGDGVPDVWSSCYDWGLSRGRVVVRSGVDGAILHEIAMGSGDHYHFGRGVAEVSAGGRVLRLGLLIGLRNGLSQIALASTSSGGVEVLAP